MTFFLAPAIGRRAPICEMRVAMFGAMSIEGQPARV
jgi:hypothetical protein